MKTMKLLSVLAFLVYANVSLAHTHPKKEDPKLVTIVAEIQRLLGNHSGLLVNKDVLAKVYFTINSKNEIVVLTINSESFELKEFIKSRLNYSKVNTKQVKQGKKYFIPVKFKAQL